MENTSKLPITSITLDPTLQPRVEGLDLEHVRALEAVAESWPPLKAVRQGEGYLLLDGFHRFAAAQNLGLAEVTVEILVTPPDGDLHGLAFALNAIHGRPLTLTDRRAFAARLLLEHPDWSDREIGRRAGLVQPTIAKVRGDLERDDIIAPAETRIGRDGRSYPANPGTSGGGSAAAGTGTAKGIGLLEAITRILTPQDRTKQRRLVQYLQRLADLLEEQNDLAGFETFDDAAEACRLVLGAEKAKELGERLGWSGHNITEIAAALGYVAAAE